MLTHPGNYIGDSWYYVQDDMVHCFYLTCPEKVNRHTAWDIGHAISSDLVNWKILDLALKKGDSDSYDGICPATGSVIRFQNHYWLAYSANWCGPNATVALAMSHNLYQWEKLSYNPVTQLDPQYYEIVAPEPRNWPHWRDPFLFEYEDFVYHFVCARSNKGSDDVRGTVGLARTRDMYNWEVLPPPKIEPVAKELECPQLYKSGELYYLVFSTAPQWFCKAFLQRYPQDDLRWSSYSMVGTTPFGPFRMHNNGQIIPSNYHVQPYANQIVFWKNQHFLIGTVWNDKQDFICDPIPVEFTETGIKILG
jgi:beta-fructofuranosidase